MTERPTFYLVQWGSHTAAGDEPYFGHTGEDEMVLVSLDAYEEMRERAERAESRIASVSGVEREELVRQACERQREACADVIGDVVRCDCDGAHIGRTCARIRAEEACRGTPLAVERTT